MDPQEFRARLASDEKFAGMVADSIAGNEATREKLMQDDQFRKDLGEKLLSEDGGILDKVKGEVDLQQLSVSEGSEDDGVEYDRKQVDQEFQVLARSAVEGRDPGEIAKSAGVDVHKDTQETDFSDAGLLIPTPLRDEIVDILDAEPAFMDAGPLVVDMPQGKMDVGRMTTDVSANWHDESTTITESDPDFDLLQLNTKKLTVRHDISNDFLRRDGAVAGRDFIMQRMMKRARNKLDNTFFEGTGTQFQPAGLDNQAGNSFSSGGNSITDIVKDLKQARNDLDGNDVPEDNRAWFMRRDVLNDFRFDINSNEDTFPFRDEIREEGTLMGDPVFTTNNISKSGSDSDIYYVEMSEALVGRGLEMELASSAHSQFSSDTTELRLVSHWDFQLLHDNAASIITSYTLQS